MSARKITLQTVYDCIPETGTISGSQIAEQLGVLANRFGGVLSRLAELGHIEQKSSVDTKAGRKTMRWQRTSKLFVAQKKPGSGHRSGSAAWIGSAAALEKTWPVPSIQTRHYWEMPQ